MEAIVSYRQIVHRSCGQRDNSATTVLCWPVAERLRKPRGHALRLQFTFLDGGFGPVGLALTPNEAAE